MATFWDAYNSVLASQQARQATQRALAAQDVRGNALAQMFGGDPSQAPAGLAALGPQQAPPMMAAPPQAQPRPPMPIAFNQAPPQAAPLPPGMAGRFSGAGPGMQPDMTGRFAGAGAPPQPGMADRFSGAGAAPQQPTIGAGVTAFGGQGSAQPPPPARQAGAQQQGQQAPPPPPGPVAPQSLDWRTVIQALQKANPGIKGQQLAAAVDQFIPLMTQQSAQDWKAMSLDLRQQSLDNQQTRANNTLEAANTRAQTAETGRQNRADATNSRLTSAHEDAFELKYDQYRDKVANEAANSDLKNKEYNLRQMAAAATEVHRAATERIQTAADSGFMAADEQKRLLAEADDHYAQAQQDINNLRSGAGQGAPGVAAQPAGASSSAGPLPPDIASKLKQGIHSTLSDGTVWTLGPDGKPQQVQPSAAQAPPVRVDQT